MIADLSYNTTVSPRDHMWNTGQQWYFEVGQSALACVQHALAAVQITPTAILDMPCGHGRVCRMLRAAYPDAHLTVCDLDPDGVDFCAATFNAVGVYSRDDVRELQLPRTFDLIWCGSLFTHLNREKWGDFLDFFERHLVPDGVLVFTTHGRQPIQWMNDNVFGYGLSAAEQAALIGDYDRTGFGFVSPSNQSFGISLSSVAFVCSQLARVGSLRIIDVLEAGWAGHQDVFACMRLRRPYRA